MIKKFTAIFLGLILMFALFGCDSSKEGTKSSGQAQTTDKASAPTKSTDEIKISVSPPEGWEPVKGSVLQVQYMKNTASFMVKDENFTGKTLDEVVAEAKGYFEKSFKNVAYVGDAQTITVDDLDARKIIFTCTVSNMQMKYEYVYLFVGKDVYAITFGDLASSFDTLTADYEQILNNISFE